MSSKGKNQKIKEVFKELLKGIKEKTFAEEIENDKNKIAAYLERYKEAIKIHGEEHIISKQEKLSTDVFKRVLILAGTNEINIQGEIENELATRNNLPVSTYLAHGGRLKIELSSECDESLINWLTSGDKNIDGKSRKQAQINALKENKIVYNRSAATHDVFRKKIKDQYHLIEKKGFMIGAKDFILNKFFSAKTNHYGVDLALNAEFGGKDSLGNIVAAPDGDHGHLYIHYKPARHPKPGSILIGVEGAAPSSSKHSKTGASDPLTPIDGSKFRDLVKKKLYVTEEIYKKTVIPKTIDGMSIKLTAKIIEGIVKLNANDYGKELAYIKPSKSVKEFSDKLAKKEFHKSPIKINIMQENIIIKGIQENIKRGRSI